MRTDGNPFFLVEYARLARERGDLAGLLAEEHPPAAVQDVLSRRLATLPEPALGTLRVACVLGRSFDVATVVSVLDAGEDDVLDHLDAALESGLVREFGVDRFRFAHALVRDAAYASLSQSRRGRMHARAAQVLAGTPGRESEVARHWLAAGPQHAAQAWRAAGDAAEAAIRVYAFDEAVELRRAALDASMSDPATTSAERYELLVGLAAALQLAGNWVELRSVVRDALRVADELDDVRRTLRAASLLSTNNLWQSGRYGEIDEEVVRRLRWVLDRLPPGDSRERCRAMVALATEIYYSSTRQERDALCEEAIAMARRLDDRRLLLWALNSTVLPIWRPGSAAQRTAISAEAIQLATEEGDGVALAVALVQHATAMTELGVLEGFEERVERARAQALEEHHLFALLVLDGLEISWRAMRDEFDAVDVLLADMSAQHERISVEQSGDALMGAVLMKMVWGGEVQVLLDALDQLEAVTVMPIESHGRDAAVPDRPDRRGPRAGEPAGDRSLPGLVVLLDGGRHGRRGCAAHRAARPRRRGVRRAVGHAPASPPCAGSGTCVGPVDAFLAMAAAATGERDLATRHAQDAVRLCEEWRIPLAARWFAEVRETYGF